MYARHYLHRVLGTVGVHTVVRGPISVLAGDFAGLADLDLALAGLGHPPDRA